MVGWLVGQSVDGNQSIWENILESEKMTRISQRKAAMSRRPPPVPSSSSSRDEELG
jgi:hypothetical protein